MSTLKLSLLACFLLCGLPLFADVADIIPAPVETIVHDGTFVVTDRVTVGYGDGLEDYAAYLADRIYMASGMALKTVPVRKADIRLTVSADSGKPAEWYSLEVGKEGVSVVGSDRAGVFYGLQTLFQLFPSEIYSDSFCRGVEWTLPYVSILDSPERPWRGMMLDVARYFYDIDFVKKYIDMMAMYKLNRLQLHLIDDSGWRIEIKKYPKLTSMGAWAGPETARLGGYYTQDELRELVGYAAFRNVEIVPELEFPAHILSAVVAYPWLSCREEQLQMPVQHFISRDLICAGKESSYEFLADVLDEITEIFPSRYVNIGGDEAVYDRWKECPHCRERMRQEGIEDASHLQGYMTNRVVDMLKAKGRTAVGWEEMILRGKIENQVTALIWHDVADSLKATRTGHKAILTPATHMYLDFPESRTPGEVKAAVWMPPISLEKCYGMQVNDYSAESTVIGVQGCFWSDQFIHGTMLQEMQLIGENRSEKYAEYMTFPRLLALSEVAWKKSSEKDWNDFRRRISTHYARLDVLDCGYRVPEPVISSVTVQDDGKTVFALEPSVAGASIVYTVDGSYPTVRSARYTGPVTVGRKDDFRAMTVLGSGRYSLPLYFEPDYSAYAEYGTFVTRWTPSVMERNGKVWTFDCNGSLRGDGRYAVTFVYTGGDGAIETDRLELIKNETGMAVVGKQCRIDRDNPVCTFELDLRGYEAGTPFSLSLSVSDSAAPYNEGLVFIKKIL